MTEIKDEQIDNKNIMVYTHGVHVHLIELNDPVHFNAESSELISDLLLCLAYSD